MPHPRPIPSHDVLAFLSEEAPDELDRLRSIDALVASPTDGGEGVPVPRLPG